MNQRNMANSYTRTLLKTTAAISLIPKPAGVSANDRLLVSECHHGIDFGCAARGKVAGRETCQRHDANDARKRCGIV